LETLDELGYAVPEKPLILSPHLLNVPQERNRVFIPGVLRSEMKNPKKYIELDFNKYFKKYTMNREKIEQQYLEKNIPSKYFLHTVKDKYLVNCFNAWNDFVKTVEFPQNKTLPVIWTDEMRNPKIKENYPQWKKDYLLKMNDFYKKNKLVIDK
jgi:DNA (cytosine-5)-methyltransferase 1